MNIFFFIIVSVFIFVTHDSTFANDTNKKFEIFKNTIQSFFLCYFLFLINFLKEFRYNKIHFLKYFLLNKIHMKIYHISV